MAQQWSRNGNKYFNKASQKYLGVTACGNTTEDSNLLELQVLHNGSGICNDTQTWNEASPTFCQNDNKNCDQWASNGECDTNPGYMKGYCRKACGLCHQVYLWVNSFGYHGGWSVEKHPRILADVNGDGKADIVGFGNEGVYVSLSTGGGFTQPSLWVDNFGYNDGWRVGQHPRFLADVNGDGKADIVGFGYPGVYVSLSTGGAFTQISVWIEHFGYDKWSVEHPRILADVNGDGKADVVGFGNDGVYVSLSTGSAFTQPSLWASSFGYNSGWRVDKHPRYLADVNSDGRADIVGISNAGAHVSLSTGYSFTKSFEW
eukprot:CAMPEP_0203667352 /NCGR_PEP_ID=MMETSP0090-20130426/4193_1 /ASSEMBLY_ACC=CAM_ASM_001088 /TAXON_ID=426623 /ORGANISM="Chaetoceros affinis, Strain CCMP159" /LENGTH=316 /DNA_ID=CAMNT_0050531473 /DNA_START=312 /DNA_END=1259 /DNA_ORIENTATION=-